MVFGRIADDDPADAAEEERRRQLRLRRHHRHVHRLGGDGRDGDEIVGAKVGDRLVDQIHDHSRLLPGLDGGLLGVLDRLLPVVAEAERARRLLHLRFAPREFTIRQRDQLLGRVRNHVVGEVANQPGAAARTALNVRGVGLARRAGRNRLARSPDLGLRRPLDIEVIDLRVAGEAIEVERLQRREPRLVIGVVGRRIRRRRGRGWIATTTRAPAATAAAATATRPAAVEPRDDVAHLVLYKPENLDQIRY